MKRIRWEDKWSAKLAKWLDLTRIFLEENNLIEKDRLLFSHIASEWQLRAENIKKSNMWLRKGLPDFIISIPREIAAPGKPTLIFIELKEPNQLTEKVSVATPEQLLWLSTLSEHDGVETKLCIRYQTAITFFLDHLSVKAKRILDRESHLEAIDDLQWIRTLRDELAGFAG